MKTFLALAIADSMFPGVCDITRRVLTIDEAKTLIAAGIESCCNRSHEASLVALKARYGIGVAVPEVPPKVALGHGDRIVVMGILGLPRLTDRHEYTADEVARAEFRFGLYSVVDPDPMGVSM